LQKDAKLGYGGSVTLGMFSTSVPLLKPACGKGIYLIKFALSAHSESPYIELATPGNKFLPAWKSSSIDITGTMDRKANTNNGTGYYYTPVLPSGNGKIDLVYTRTTAMNGGFKMGFKVVGQPDDKSTLPKKITGGWQQKDPVKICAEGWIELKQP
jgi:hypothetical protein